MRTDGQTDGRNDANSLFSHFCEQRLEIVLGVDGSYGSVCVCFVCACCVCVCILQTVM